MNLQRIRETEGKKWIKSAEAAILIAIGVICCIAITNCFYQKPVDLSSYAAMKGYEKESALVETDVKRAIISKKGRTDFHPISWI